MTADLKTFLRELRDSGLSQVTSIDRTFCHRNFIHVRMEEIEQAAREVFAEPKATKLENV